MMNDDNYMAGKIEWWRNDKEGEMRRAGFYLCLQPTTQHVIQGVHFIN